MKIRTKLFEITDSKGNDIDPEDHDIIIMQNGEPTETRLADIFTDLELDENEIYGNSLLSYYELKDGKLSVEGSMVEFAIAGSHERVLITAIKRPSVNDDSVIPFEHIQKFVEFFKVAKPEEVFTDLNENEKQIFINARLDASIASTTAAEATKAADKEKTAAEAKKAEAELKAGIDPKFIHNKKDYLSTQTFYRGIDFKEYIDGPYHLFNGKSDNEAPFVLIKRGTDWWQEPHDTQIADETDTTMVVEFSDGNIIKRITLNTDSGATTITDAE